jgi:pimeloyl-ACP methyl ester carboxylesterase
MLGCWDAGERKKIVENDRNWNYHKRPLQGVKTFRLFRFQDNLNVSSVFIQIYSAPDNNDQQTVPERKGPKMPLLKTKGAEIFHQSRGEGEIVLFSHGYMATGEMWCEQLKEPPDGYCFVSWEMRGHGRSSSPSDSALYSEQATLDDMAALLDYYGAGRAILVGHSLGGYMSLAFCIKHPERVRGLVLVSCGPGYRSDKVRADWNRIAERQAKKIEQEGLKVLSHYSDIDVSLHRDAIGLIYAARGMLTQRDDRVINALPDIDVPTLVIVGEHDKHYRNAAGYMATKIRHATHHEIPGAGHMSNTTDPASFNRALHEFLKKCCRRETTGADKAGA